MKTPSVLEDLVGHLEDLVGHRALEHPLDSLKDLVGHHSLCQMTTMNEEAKISLFNSD